MNQIKQMRRWICWDLKTVNGRKTKVPCAASGSATGTNEKYAHTWVTFDEAASAMQLHGHTGVGFVIPEGMFFVDKDGTDLNATEVEYLREKFQTYAEVSFSGNGLHFYGYCDMKRVPMENGKLVKRYYTKNSTNGLEVYIGGLTNRFAAFTGNMIQDMLITDCTDALLTFLDEKMLRNRAVVPEMEIADDTVAEDDPRIFEIVCGLRGDRNGAKFYQLFDEGDTTGYGSHSEADAALCAIIAFRAGPNPALIDAIFRKSALYRADKWERDDYRAGTIACGIEACRGVYHHSVKTRPEFVMVNTQNGTESVSATRLAKFIRENLRYVFVQDHAMSTPRCYVYRNGAYRLMSRTMMLGVIKQYIIDYDEHLVKTRTLNEVYELLLTDNFFVAEEDLNFQCYELLLADIVELRPSQRQKADLQKLMQQSNDYYYFATAEEINALGVQSGTDRLQETIGDHSVKILQETEQHLERIRGYGEKYTVSLN